MQHSLYLTTKCKKNGHLGWVPAEIRLIVPNFWCKYPISPRNLPWPCCRCVHLCVSNPELARGTGRRNWPGWKLFWTEEGRKTSRDNFDNFLDQLIVLCPSTHFPKEEGNPLPRCLFWQSTAWGCSTNSWALQVFTLESPSLFKINSKLINRAISILQTVCSAVLTA